MKPAHLASFSGASYSFAMRMPSVGNLARKNRGRSGNFLLELLLGLALLGCGIAWILISWAVADKRQQMIGAMLDRAEALCGAIEGSQNFPGRRGGKILSEMARKAGAAWVAIVDAHGIVLEASRGIRPGELLPVAEDIATLAPGEAIQGRFSPRDAGIYETWKIFQPHDGIAPDTEKMFIFSGVRSKAFHRRIAAYARELWLIAVIVILILLGAVTLAFFLRSYRKNTRQLADTRALAEQVIMSYPGALVVADNRGDIALANAGGRDILAGAETLARLPGLGWQKLRQKLADGMTPVNADCELRNKSGASLPSRITAAAISDSLGRQAGYLVIIRDMGEIRRLEKKLRQNERLCALGNLAAGLAHEIRNPLSSIKGYAAYLAEKVDADPVARGAAELLAEETGRLNRVLSDLLGLARQPRLTMEELQPALIAEKAINLARPEARAKNITLEMDCQRAVACIRGDADRLLQALMNLLINAIQAAPDGGKVCVGLNENSSTLQITVSDNGPGMDAEIAAQIFTPYFTTKARGTGLGLAIVQQIAEAHGGTISVASRPGHGAVFTLELPFARASGGQNSINTGTA